MGTKHIKKNEKQLKVKYRNYLQIHSPLGNFLPLWFSPPLIKLSLPLSLHSLYDILSPFLSWNSYISSSSFLWIWSNWVCSELNFISHRELWWCRVDVSPDILVLNSWIDDTMWSSFSLRERVLKCEPLWDVEVSGLFRLWPMLALNVRMLIGLSFEQGDSARRFICCWINSFELQDPWNKIAKRNTYSGLSS